MDPLLETALRAALAGGEEVMRVYADPFEVTQKTDKTPVTAADLASEKVIIEILTQAFPDIPVVSEETVPEEGFSSPAARFWCVDPLDGTREFVARNGEFAVLVGLIENGRPVLGVVHGPAAGVTYLAHGPGTAQLRRNGGAFEPIRARAPADGVGVLAAGEADLYPRFGTTMEWDTAAGQAVLEAAGGHVLDLSGEPMTYGKPGLKNDGFVAWGAKPAW
jgi:3'(2'), 5'-bisphosphate nucleotidase